MLYDFSKTSNINDWQIVDDVVMGGRSSGSMTLNSEGNGVFQGKVSLENNGGFSSIRYPFKSKDVRGYEKFVIRIKGDGNKYQLRVKDEMTSYYSYITYFESNGDWQTIEIPFKEMYPSFRGRKLDQPNFPGQNIEELGFLVGNKRAETFRLEIDKIEVR
jgi:hypothetical protein